MDGQGLLFLSYRCLVRGGWWQGLTRGRGGVPIALWLPRRRPAELYELRERANYWVVWDPFWGLGPGSRVSVCGAWE